MSVTIEQIRKAAKGKVNEQNANSVLVALEKFGAKVGLDQPHRLAHYFSQLMHESGSFKYDREIWGPTPAQKRYDTRADLGNTPALDGDGKLYMGRTGIQLTGKANYDRFTKWVRKYIDKNAPDFVKNPELVNTDPWEGLVPIWFWTVGNSTGKSLNVYADQNNAEMITKRINGGLNGYADRLEYYDRIGFVMLGYKPVDYLAFQKAAPEYKGAIDGDAGPKTRAAIHAQLVKLTNKADRAPGVQAAPVATEKPVAVTMPDADKPSWQSPEVAGTVLAPVLTAVASLDWRVAVAAVTIGAVFGGFLIVRRDRMKAAQAAQIEAIVKAGEL